MKRKESQYPLGYLITVTCYGTWLHGDPRGGVHREDNVYGSPSFPPSRSVVRGCRDRMAERAYALAGFRPWIVRDSFVVVCRRRDWHLIAAHVRRNHWHAVVAGETNPEEIMVALKSAASKALNRLEVKKKRWTRHGSTGYLWTRERLDSAVDYVLKRQGPPLALDPAPTEPRLTADPATLATGLQFQRLQ